MKSYHFNFGDSHTGPIGCCARVTAESKKEAVKLLRATLRTKVRGPEIEYIHVYLNDKFVSTRDIDEIDELEASV